MQCATAVPAGPERQHAVSTHAPARGASGRTSRRCAARSFFNPRARTGRDPTREALPIDVRRFNPRARTGRDGALRLLHASPRWVSTHAPARGATATSTVTATGLGPFQPTRPHGARPRGGSRPAERVQFQPTRPHGARPSWPRRPWRHRPCFNPRARTGRDDDPATAPAPLLSFNPRTRTGRDASAYGANSGDRMFQPTRPHGARQEHGAPCPGPLSVSTHAPARGATALGREGVRMGRGFNPRARTGRDMRRPSPHR